MTDYQALQATKVFAIAGLDIEAIGSKSACRQTGLYSALIGNPISRTL